MLPMMVNPFDLCLLSVAGDVRVVLFFCFVWKHVDAAFDNLKHFYSF